MRFLFAVQVALGVVKISVAFLPSQSNGRRAYHVISGMVIIVLGLLLMEAK